MNLGEIRRQHCLDCRAIQRKTAEKALQCQDFTAKTQRDARQNPSETDFPRFLLRRKALPE